MEVSYNWLKTYFKDPLPEPEKLAELFTFRFAEVESVFRHGNDTVLDVKVLPDRAHYALCHKGIATEIAAITGIPAQFPNYNPPVHLKNNVEVRIDEDTLCRRYTARRIENISVGPSPEWLVNSLVAVGQRSINNIVDATNFSMLDIGQPLHAFDADKVDGRIIVRRAQEGEKIVTFDNKEVMLFSDVLVIADDSGPLAIAGIKGGKRAEVNEGTKNIILEAADFDPAHIRKTSLKIGIRTDSSKRFENEITPEWASIGNDRCTALISEMMPEAKVGELADIYPVKAEMRTIMIDPKQVMKLLGVEISEEKIVRILSTLGIKATNAAGNLALIIPSERLDLGSLEDIAEEIGRIHGYENIRSVPPPKLTHPLVPLKSMYYEEKIRDVFVGHGFSEIITYSFRNIGFIEIEKSLASDKNFLRGNLTSNIEEALSRNAHNADLLGLDDIKTFEIGTLFEADGEYRALSIGVKKLKKQKGITAESIIKDIVGKIATGLGVAGLNVEGVLIPSSDSAVWQIKIDDIIRSLPEPTAWNNIPYTQENITYKKISQYPFMVRDIAMFVPIETKQEEIADVLKHEAGELLVTMRLFDIFTKTFPDGSQKTSYAFRLVFQSYEKTLEDSEANVIMDRIYRAVALHDWEVR